MSELIVLAGFAERLCRVRKGRDRDLAPVADMFCDPAWDILLDLFISHVRARPVSVSSACIAAGAPNTTSLRWLLRLEQAGALERVPDPKDARRSFVALTPDTFKGLAVWLRRARQQLLGGS